MALVESFLKNAFEKNFSRTREETARVLRYKSNQLQSKCKELKDCERKNVELEKLKEEYLQRETILVKLLRKERMRVKLMETEIELLNKSEDINDEIVHEVEQLVSSKNENVDFAAFHQNGDKEKSVKGKPVVFDIDEATDDEDEFFTDIKEITKEVVVSVNETTEPDHQNVKTNTSDSDLEAETGDVIEHLLNDFAKDREQEDIPENEPINESNISSNLQSQLLPNFSQFDDQSDILLGCELEPSVISSHNSDSRVDFNDYKGGKRKRKETTPYAVEIMKEYHESGRKRSKPATKYLGRVNTGSNFARKRRNKSCGSCSGCRREECRKCRNCKDMPKFGGEGKIKQKCLERICLNSV